MLLLKRALPVAVPLLVLASLEFVFWRPGWIYAPLAASLLMVMLASRYMATSASRAIAQNWNFLISPTIFVAAGFLFVLFPDSSLAKHGVSMVIALLLGIYFEHLFRYFNQPFRYQIRSLENSSLHLNLIAFFMLTSGLSSAVAFFHLPLWIPAIVVLICGFLLAHQTIWIAKVRFSVSWPFVSAITLISLEIFWIFWFLPISYYVKGLLMLSVFYILSGYSRAYLTETFSRTVALRYAVLCGIISIISLGTARWL